MTSSSVGDNSGFSARSIIVPAIIIGSILLIGWMVYKFFEWKEVEVSSGFSTEANEHDFLAASRYLSEFGYDTKQITGLDFFAGLPPTDHVILSQYLPGDLPESHYQNLFDWVANGGHLISGVLDTSEDSPTTDFLNRFDVRIKQIDWDDDNDYYDPKKLTGSIPPDSTPITIEIQPDHKLQLADNIEPLFGLKGRQNNYDLVQIQNGEGHLTLLSDNYIFSNWDIGAADNALLLKRLVETGNAETVWINDTYVSFQGIFSLIWEKFKWLVLLLAALLVLLIRHFSVRLGPLERFPETQSSNFSQHLLAMTRFHYRHGSRQDLLNTTREKLIRKISAGKNLSTQEIIKKYAQITTLSADQIHHALFDKVSSTSALTTATESLHLLSRQLNKRHR